MKVTSLRRLVAGLCGLAISGLSLNAQSITNPSFEADVFTVAPGSAAANGGITGWSFSDATRAGLSPAGGLNAFANNGVTPNGTNVLYLQTTNVAWTDISGLTPGSKYTLRFRANSQSATTPTLRASLDGQNLIDIGSVVSVGAGAPYQFVSLEFTAAAATQTLYLTNNSTAATAVLLLDDFSVAPSVSGWSFTVWTNDASSGIDSSKNYTHAYAFNVTGVPVPVNGVNFTRLAGANPQVPYEFQSANLGSATTDGGNVLRTAAGGSSSNLAFGFVYNGNPEILNIQNLVPGTEYLATIYSVGWDPRAYGRSVTWRVGNDMISVNEDQFGDGVGIRISYRFIAPPAGYLTISNFPFSTAVGTFHIFAFANYEVNPQSTPVIGVQPVSKAAVPGGGAGFYVTAGGARPLSYRWLKDGSEMANQTNRFLNLTNLTSADLAGYSVVVSNASGVITSAVANLTFSGAQIPNPSFEEDGFLSSPGYSSVNFPIAGWISSNPGRTGINPLADVIGPFANTGVVPDGRNAAFIQGANTLSSLRTVISGLEPGSNYTVRFRSNGRNNGTSPRAQLKLAVDDKTIVDTIHNPVGGTNQYRFVAFDFTASSNSAVLALTNDTVSDFSVNVDAFTIQPSTSKWTFAVWTNDATAGIDPSKLYTHAYHFGAAVTDTNISGVTFKGLSGVNPSIPGFFSMSGFGSAFAGDANTLTTNGGGSAGIASTFIYGGPIQTITLSNLSPGTEYVASIYGIGFDPKTYGRSATFDFNGDQMTINEDHFGNDNGIIVSYPYTAPSNGTVRIVYTPTDSSSTFHTYAFANRVKNDSAPVIGAQPQDAFVSIGSSVNLSVGLSAGSLPLSFQWQLNGVDIPDATNSTLALSNLNSFGASGYTVVVSNFLGSITSVLATVEVGTPLSEVFNTGVDAANNFLPGGIVDTHYRLVSSPDPFFPGPDAVTMHNGAFPLAGNYFTNGLYSSWIAPRTNSSIGNSNGFYVYRTTFIIDTADPARSQIDGKWASDNEGVAILLNGASTGISNMVSGAFTTFYPFRITNGFVAGTNVIDFVISNGPATGPTGLRVEMTGVGRPLTNTPPSIVSEPVSRTVGNLSSASLTVLASGSAALNYQWYKFGDALPDATNRTLTLFAPLNPFDDAADYFCIVTNSFGAVTSQTASISIIIQPGIDSTESTNQVVECGTAAFLAVYAYGDEPISYQWYFGTNAMVGATNYDLTLTGPTLIAGNYFVVLTNGGGSLTSSVFTVGIVDTTRPEIVTCASNLTIVAGTNCLATVPDFRTQVVATDCSTFTISQSPTPGSPIGIGSHTVTLTLTDSSGNATNCTATLTVDTAVPAVALSISAQGTNALITWPTAAGHCWELRQTQDLNPPQNWSPVTNAVSVDGANFSVTVERAATNSFFKLQRVP